MTDQMVVTLAIATLVVYMLLVISSERRHQGARIIPTSNKPIAPPPPPIIDNNGWIPVSERLPDAYQLVLATYEDKRIEIAFIHLGGVWSGYFWGEVIAWQPLPEPYREVWND